MKSLTRTIILLVIINLTIGNFALAQDTREQRIAAEPVEPQAPEPLPVPTPVEPTPPKALRPGGMTISGNVGLSGVEMQGLPGIVVTDSRGYYSATVPPGWSGRVMPVREGYNFEPASIIYRKVVSDRTNENYTMAPMTFIISGKLGVGGVVMRGLPGNPVTGRDGTYQATVKYGWSGTVKPKKDGVTFEPTELRYSGVMKDLTNNDYSPKRIGPAPMFARTGSRKVLVIPATDIEAENLVAITEDLQVMSHIFDERFKEPQEIQGVFVDFGDIFGRDSRSTEAIYLQGYGALFLMEVNFTFSPEPEPQEQEVQETEEYIDPDWQRAKQKLFSPKGFGGGDFAQEEQYSAQQIDQIKTELIRTLKHTANIRNLQPDEWIILTVIGQSRQAGGMYEDYYRSAAPGSGTSRSRGRSSSSSRGSYGGGIGGGMGGGYGISGGMMMGGGMGGMAGGGMGGQAFGGGVMMGGGMGGMAGGGMGGQGFGGGMMGGMEYGETGSASTTVLTIRSKKTDVDAFAIGELDFEQFQQKVEIFTY